MTENTGITNSYVTVEMLDQYEFESSGDYYFFDYLLQFYVNEDGNISLYMRDRSGLMEELTSNVTMADFDAVRLLTRGQPKRKGES